MEQNETMSSFDATGISISFDSNLTKNMMEKLLQDHCSEKSLGTIPVYELLQTWLDPFLQFNGNMHNQIKGRTIDSLTSGL